MLDKLLTRAGIAIALILMVAELSYINAKSLLFIVAERKPVDQIFAVAGALAFSMVTVIVMRKSTQYWLKIAFPVFDALLVFCGFNLIWYGNMIDGQDNQIRFYLTIFMSVFTGLITYSLGIINYKEHAANQAANDTVCEYCGRKFKSEASKRSHKGKCPNKPKN